MALTSAAERSDAPPPSLGQLWFALWAGPLAWAAQGLLGWWIGGSACANGTPGTSVWHLSIGGLQVLVGVISVIAILIALAGLVIGYRSYQRSTPQPDLSDIRGRGRVDFMAASGLLVSSIFVIATVWAGLTSVLVNPCGTMR